ncbi:MAG: hypothetical protein C0494_05875 [Sphingobium sp.]|nr:hypothetical protein [Sphingobium sp.]
MNANQSTALLAEVQSILHASSFRLLFRLFCPRLRVLADRIATHLETSMPPPIAHPAVTVARYADFNLDIVTVDEGEIEVAPSTAGVWVRSWVLVNWEALLPTAMPRALDARHRTALSALHPDTRDTYLLHRIGGLDIEQVAWLHGVDVAKSQKRLARGLAAIAHDVDRPTP